MDSYSSVNKNNRSTIYWSLTYEELQQTYDRIFNPYDRLLNPSGSLPEEGISAAQSKVVDELLSSIFADEVIFMITSYIESNWMPRHTYLLYKLIWRQDDEKWRKKYLELRQKP